MLSFVYLYKAQQADYVFITWFNKYWSFTLHLWLDSNDVQNATDQPPGIEGCKQKVETSAGDNQPLERAVVDYLCSQTKQKQEPSRQFGDLMSTGTFWSSFQITAFVLYSCTFSLTHFLALPFLSWFRSLLYFHLLFLVFLFSLFSPPNFYHHSSSSSFLYSLCMFCHSFDTYCTLF